MAACPLMRPRRTGSVFALTLALVGLLAPLGAHAAVPTVTGTVTSRDGGPIVGGTVSIGTYAAGALVYSTFGGGNFSVPLPASYNVVGGVSLGVTVLPDYHYGADTHIWITCALGGYTLTCDPIPPVTFSVASSFGNIAGTVWDATGRPVAGATVSAIPVGGTAGPHTVTTATGAYLFPPWPGAPSVFGASLGVPEGGTRDYVVSVTPREGPAPAPKTVTLSGGAIARADFGGPSSPIREDRPLETAFGPPNCPECCPLFRGSPVHIGTGNMYTQQEDLAYPSAFGRLAFTRTYNSQSTHNGPLGLGWTHPYDFELTELRPGVIRIRNGAGNVRFYELVAGSSDTYRVAAPARDTSSLLKHAGGFTETERDGLRREFDSNGRLQTIVTRAGWRTLFTYANGRLATVTDPGGRVLTFTYSTTGQLTRVEGPGGLFAQYTYDPQGRLVSAADALGTRWTYTYSDTTPSRLTSVRDANGHVVESHTYDSQGRVIATTEADGVKALTLAYLDASHTRVTDSLGRITTYTFGTFGDLLLVTQIQGPCVCGSPDTTFEYDTQGRRTRQTDARGNSTAFEYDPEGNLIKVTDALGQTTASTYNPFGQVLTTTDPTGATTTFDYDVTTGFLRQVTDALGHSTILTPEVHTLPGAVTNPRGHTTTFAYADTGLLTTLTDPTGARTTFAYDDAGRLRSVTDAAAASTGYTYDGRGRLLTVTDPVGAVTQFGYDPAGNRVGLTDPKGRRTTSTYDAANRLIGVTDPAGGTTAYTYDTERNLLTVADAKGQTTTFAYDAHNRLVTRTDPVGASETFTYDPAGNLTARTDRKGQTLTYTYDALNRLTAKTLPGGTPVTYAYDPLGRLLAAADATGPLAFTYDPLGRVLTTTTPEGRTLTFTYDSTGNRIGLQDETGTLTTYAYDPRNLLTALSDPRAGVFTFGYDSLARRSSLTRPNGTSTGYTYDPAARLTGLTHGGPKGPFEALAYTYDPASNRTADTRNRTAHQYAYDPLDQLTQVQRQEQRSRWKVEEAYSYDPIGNRLTSPHKETSSYDAANRLTQDTTSAYAYDANGNLIEKRSLKDGRVTTYTYDAEDRLIRVVTPKAEVTFQYDPLGRRIEKRVVRWHDEDGDREPDEDEEGTPQVIRYLYDQEDILATFDDTGRTLARYTHGPGIDEPLAEVRKHRTRFYHADTLGSIIALTEKHGHAVRNYRYSAFGIPEDHRGDPQPYRYTGREWDKEVGLYYYRARYYGPRMGRFIQEEPIFVGAGRSCYRYSGNSPTNAKDPFGLKCWGWQREYFDRWGDVAKELGAKFNIPPATILIHSGIESDYGRSEIARKANNLTGQWGAGPAGIHRTRGGRLVAKYNDPRASLEKYAETVAGGRYGVAGITDPSSAYQRLLDRGYVGRNREPSTGEYLETEEAYQCRLKQARQDFDRILADCFGK